MGQEKAAEQGLTPNQIVAWNLRRAREIRKMTQEEAAKALAPYLGVEWKGPQFSVAERWNPAPGQKVRQFGMDELLAFSLAFELPVGFFLGTDRETVKLPGGEVPAETVMDSAGGDSAGVQIAELRGQLDELTEQVQTFETTFETLVQRRSAKSAKRGA